MKRNTRTYSELNKIESFEDRFEYLKLGGAVGEMTFGGSRYLNQKFYSTLEWKQIRNEVIIRDDGCDLGHPDHPIKGKVYIHHLNPVTKEQIINRDRSILNPEYLVCVSYETHQAIHYSDANLLQKDYIERKPNDTCPWK